MDSLIPITLWPAFTYNVTLTNEVSPEFELSCSRSGCRFAYVLDGEFAVVTKGKGKQRVRVGEIEWAPKGVVHYSVNETKKPARVLVVLLKGR